jgi:hypothetical protein
MKKLLLYFSFAILIVTSFSCKKDDVNTGSYFKIKVDGNWKTYTNAIAEYGPDNADPSLINIVVNGYNNDHKELVSFHVQRGGSLSTGTYHYDNQSYWIGLDWFTDFNTNDMRNFTIYSAPGMPEPTYSITITSITDTHIKGSFTGNYLYDSWSDDPQEGVRRVTEGEFVAKRID